MVIMLLVAIQASATPPVAATPAPAAQATAQPQPPDFQVGVSRIADVTAKLGKPGSVTTISDGTTIAAWVSTRTKVKGASFVPVVGLFAGGAKSRVSVKVFTFGPDGLLKSFTSTDSSTDCNVGIQGASCHAPR